MSINKCRFVSLIGFRSLFMAIISYKKSIIIILFLLAISFVNGQNSNKQKLIEFSSYSIKTEKKEDSTVKLYNNHIRQSQFFIEKNLDSAIYFAQKAVDISEKEKSNEKIAKAYQNLGIINLKKGDQIAFKKNILSANTHYLFEKDSTSVAFMNINIGAIYYQNTNLDESLKSLLLAYDFLKTKKTTRKLIEAVNMIGGIYSDIEMIDKSQEFHRLSIKLSIELNNPEVIITSKNKMGLLYVKQHKYIDAKKCFKEAVAIGETNDKFKDELLIGLNGIANVHFHLGNYQRSLDCLDKVLKVMNIKEPTEESAHVYHAIGFSLMGLKKYKESEKYLLKAHRILAKNSSKNVAYLIECNKGLYQLYEKLNNYEKAFKYFQSYHQIKDSIYGKEINEKIVQLESDRIKERTKKAYTELQLKSENEKLKYDSRITNITTIWAILLITSLCVFMYYLFRNKTRKAEAELLLVEDRFNSLHSQMNPHFIFNVINGVQNYILKADKYAAYEHLTLFANSIRLIINNASKSFIPLKDELELIKTYIDLEKVRFRDDFEYEMHIHEGFNKINPLIPSMIIQPVVENAIIHGLSNKQGNGHLIINFEYCHKTYSIKCTIIDNGIGRKEASKIKRNKNQEEHLSISTTNSQQRIEILNKMGFEHAKINIEDLVDEKDHSSGTKVTINLPIKKNE